MKGCVNDKLAQLDVGEAYWVQSSPKTYQGDMRKWNPPSSRRTDKTRNMVFSCAVFHTTRIGEYEAPQLLLRVTRTK